MNNSQPISDTFDADHGITEIDDTNYIFIEGSECAGQDVGCAIDPEFSTCRNCGIADPRPLDERPEFLGFAEDYQIMNEETE